MSCRAPRGGICRRSPFAFFCTCLLLLNVLLLARTASAFTAVALGDHDNVAVMEVSGNFDALDDNGQPNLEPRRAIAREFYRNHGDDYDFLVIFTNFPYLLTSSQAKAFFSPARNDVQGIGLELYDNTPLYTPAGSSLARLQGTVDMGDIVSHVLESADPEFDDTLRTLTHEMLHRWGAYVQFLDNGAESDALLGLDRSHWSFLFGSEGSTLYGNNWRDNGDGTFTAMAPEQARAGEVIGRVLSPLELYLMGLVDKRQVPPMLLIDAPGIDRTRLPEIGATIPGMARTVTIDDIIAAEGERIPNAADARKEFRVAFIYAVTHGTWHLDALGRGEVASINRLQQEWEKRISILTGGAALMRTALVIAESVVSNPDVSGPPPDPAVASDANLGVAWLTVRQRADGHWEDRPDTALRDTATAIAALRPTQAGAASAAAGRAWLGTVAAENHDFQARQLDGLGSTDLSELMARQNADGGWGSASGFRSSPIDTALMLAALAAQGGCNGRSEIAAAVAWLHAGQNSDGGWGAGGGVSQLLPTTQALLALAACREAYPLEPVLADGRDWLVGKRNADGGLGDGPSTVVGTALALQAFRANGGAPEVMSAATRYLLDKQSADGSWGGNVFQTALAVAALLPAAAAPPTISFVQDTAVGFEGERTVAVEVVLSHSWGQPVSVEFHLDPAGTASPGEDFTLAGGSVTFPAWETTRSINLVLSDDEQSEPEETIVITLANPTGSATIAAGQYTYLLRDNEAAPEVEIISPLAKTYATRSLSVSYAASHGTPSIFLDGTPIVLATDGLLHLEQDGIFTLKVEATDAAGQVGSREVTFAVDTVGPAVTIVSPVAGVFPEEHLPLLCEVDGGVVTAVHLDGAAITQRCGGWVGPLADGAHRLAITARDDAGNETVAGRDFTVAASNAEPVPAELPPDLLDYREIIRTGYVDSGQMAVDTVGNSYFATHVRDPSGTHDNIKVHKFNRDGLPAWPQPVILDFPFNARVKGVVADRCGNLYVAGTTRSTVTTASGELKEDWDDDLFVARISSSGALAWIRTWGSIQNDDLYALALGGDGRLYLTGRSDGPIDGSYGDNGDNLVFISVFDEGGTRTLNRNYPLPTGNGIAADQSGNIFFSNFVELRKYAADGSFAWSRPYGLASGRIAIDRDGSLFLGRHPLLKVEPQAGAIVWSAAAITSTPFPAVASNIVGTVDWLTIDDNGDVYMFGTTARQLEGHVSLDGNDPFLAKFDRNGRKVWVKQLDAPLEGMFLGAAVAGDRRLYTVKRQPVSAAFSPDQSFSLVTLVSPATAESAGTPSRYYLASSSGCAGSTYSHVPVRVALHRDMGGCDLPDRAVVTARGTKEILLAAPADGYLEPTLVELAGYGNSLSFLAADADGTATVALLEIDPLTGSVVRELAARSFALTAGRLLTISDLAGLSGPVAEGRTFGIRLTVSTGVRSTNTISWGSAGDCPPGSRQSLLVLEQQVDTEAPFSSIIATPAGSSLPTGCSLLEGGAGDGAGSGVVQVEVSVDGGRSWQSATDVSADRSWAGWAFPWCHLQPGVFLVRSRATDRAGNVEVPGEAVAVTVGSPDPLGMTIEPASITQDESADVILTVTGLDPRFPTIRMTMVHDAGADFSPEGDPAVRIFHLTDGLVAGSPERPGDSDGVMDGRIVARLPFHYVNDVQMAPGRYLFVADSVSGSAVEPFAVDAVSRAQTIGGYVLDPLGQPLSGATVRLLDKWGNEYGYAVTDDSGRYHFNVSAPGDYLLVPALRGYVFDKAGLVPHLLRAGEELAIDLRVEPGLHAVGGQLLNAINGLVLPGAVQLRAESSHYLAAVMSETPGAYGLTLPDGDYQLFADAFTVQGAAPMGCLGSRAVVGRVTVAGEPLDQDVTLQPATQLICGAVAGPAGDGIGGIVLEAGDERGAGSFAAAVTAADGRYCLGVNGDSAWRITLNDAAVQPLGYLGTEATGVVADGRADLVAFPRDSWLEGSVTDEARQPLAAVPVKVSCAATGAVATGRTAADGSWRLGVHAGAWQAAVITPPPGHAAAAPVSLVVAAGGTATGTFVLPREPQMVNTIAITKAAFDARKKILNIEATSSYDNARLQVDGYGPMMFSKLFKGKYFWKFSQGLPASPATVTVSGVEGSRTATVQ